jgi:hypothetical protein
VSWVSNADELTTCKLTLHRIINSQTVVITALLDKSPEKFVIPRYLLEKHSSLFKEELAAYDISDPAKIQQTIPLSLATWYNRMRTGHVQSEWNLLRDWNMLQLFCKWMLCGRIIGEPMIHPKDLPWEKACDPLFMADVAIWILEGTKKRMESQASAAKY